MFDFDFNQKYIYFVILGKSNIRNSQDEIHKIKKLFTKDMNIAHYFLKF